MWMILGRVLTALMLGDRDNVIMGMFRKVTDPVYRVTKTIMPFAKEGWLPFLSIVIIIILRLLLIILSSPTGVQK